jgi:tetratricopeptide (TPR) repeat protein
MADPLLILLGIIVLLAGCAAQPPARPLPSAQARQHNLNGVKATLDANFVRARQQFERSEQLYASIEDNSGRLMPLLNLSRLNRRLGFIDAAAGYIDLALSLAGPSPSGDLIFEKALVLRRQGKMSQAADWGERALETATPDQYVRNLNFLGRLALEAGDLTNAQDFVSAALAAKQPAPPTERANSLRLQGQIFLEQKNLQPAEIAFEQALQLDKQLELGPRIASDLEGLASVYLQRQNQPVAIAFLNRALNLYIYNHDKSGACTVFARLKPICIASQQCEGLLSEWEEQLQCD